MKNQNRDRGKKPVGIAAVLLVAAMFAGRILLGDAQTVKEASNAVNAAEQSIDAAENISCSFRTEEQLNSHYEKHGRKMGFASPQEYLAAANKVVTAQNVLHKIEAEDGDDVYYLEETNEFVIVSADGYIRTYFNPDDGIDYYNRQ